jgi:calcineurin-like phosphoesterase family protein
MNEDLINKWNEKIGPNDTVHHLGDFAYGPMAKDPYQVQTLLSRLNGKVHLIMGNHDEQISHVIKYNKWESVKWLDYLTFDKQKIVLCHYPMKSWRSSYHGSWMLFGHCHGTLPDEGVGKTFDIGVDCHNFEPLSYEEVRKIMDKRPCLMKEVGKFLSLTTNIFRAGNPPTQIVVVPHLRATFIVYMLVVVKITH